MWHYRIHNLPEGYQMNLHSFLWRYIVNHNCLHKSSLTVYWWRCTPNTIDHSWSYMSFHNRIYKLHRRHYNQLQM